MSSAEEIHVPSLQRSKTFAMLALIMAVVAWVVLMITAHFLPEYKWIIHIFMLGAEAGVVGGLADWYAVTVLFRNPFGKMPLPKLLRDHTEIIPRNKARIAESMGRFVQENFLSPQIVQRSLQNVDISLAAGDWLANPKNNKQVVQMIQHTVPKIFEFVSQDQISNFVQNNSVQWVRSTKINNLASEMLRAVLENDFHQDVLQRGLDLAHEWMVSHPEQVRELSGNLFKELGVWKLAKGASWIGIDVQQRTIDSMIEKVESMLANPEHPWRQDIESNTHWLMLELANAESNASLRLNDGKNALLDSPQVLNFISGAVAILCDAIKTDLEQPDSGIAANLQIAIQQLGESLMQNENVRQVLNEKMVGLATNFSELGGDLHMIRVNGVIVGAFIGLALGVIRAIVENVL
mgnify:FL=1